MENLLTAVSAFLSLDHVLGLFTGMIIGIAIGAIPGLGPTVVIALTMPLLIRFDATLALLIMIGIYIGGIYGGSLSAIWINAPGTPASAVTAMEGYLMRSAGYPVKALQCALWASIFGHFFASIILFIACEPLARLSLNFGSAEQFALIFCAMTVISVISGKDKKKGLTAAALGFIISLIGTDPITGYTRLCFGSFYLRDGVELFALLIGIFAVSETLVQNQALFQGRSARIEKISFEKRKDDYMPVRAFFRHWPLLLRSSAIGAFIGALPGIGPVTASFVSYGVAQKASKHPEKFGHGSEEGLMAGESANNAVCSAAMIPMLSLGIPGDATTAVLLGALVLFGMAPGPMLFVNNGPMVRIIYVGIFACGLLLLIFGRLIIRSSTLIAYVQPRILWPCIAVMCILGVFSTNSSIFDVWIMLAFGLLGYVMNRFGFPAAPLLIAYILAGSMEVKLRRALVITNNDVFALFKSPLFSVIIGISVLIVAVPIISEQVKARKNKNLAQAK